MKSKAIQCQILKDSCTPNAKCYQTRTHNSCTDGRTGYIEDSQIPSSFNVKVFEPYGENMKGGTYKVVKLKNDKKFTLKDFLSESESVRSWLHEKKIYTQTPLSDFVLNYKDDTDIYESATGSKKVEKPSADTKYTCFWKETPLLTQAKCQNSQPVCSGVAQCTSKEGITSSVRVNCLEKSAGTSCKSASACASADDSLEIAISSCRPKIDEVGIIGDRPLTNPIGRERKENPSTKQ